MLQLLTGHKGFSRYISNTARAVLLLGSVLIYQPKPEGAVNKWFLALNVVHALQCAAMSAICLLTFGAHAQELQ